MKKLKILSGFFLFVIFSFVLSSCTAPTYITNWRDANYTGQFKKVLVVALIKDLEFRKAYENNLVSVLKENGVTGVASLNQLPYDKQISKSELEKVVTDGGYDGLLIMQYQGTKTTNEINYSYYDYYSRWYSGYPGTYIESHKTVKMESRLFSADKKKPVWVGQTKTIDAYSAGELAKSVADEIVANLQSENLIKTVKK